MVLKTLILSEIPRSGKLKTEYFVCVQRRHYKCEQSTDNIKGPRFKTCIFKSSLLYLCINDKYQCAGSSEDHLIIKGRVKKVYLTRKVPDLKVDKRAAGDVILVDFIRALQKQGLIGGHLMKHDLRRESLLFKLFILQHCSLNSCCWEKKERKKSF